MNNLLCRYIAFITVCCNLRYYFRFFMRLRGQNQSYCALTERYMLIINYDESIVNSLHNINLYMDILLYSRYSCCKKKIVL